MYLEFSTFSNSLKKNHGQVLYYIIIIIII